MVFARLLKGIVAAFAICVAGLGSAHSAGAPVSRYVHPDGRQQFVFADGKAVISRTPAAQRNDEIGGVVERDNGLTASFRDCSTVGTQCVEVGDGHLVFAVNFQAFETEKAYQARGFQFVPTCVGKTRPPKCSLGMIRFSNGARKGYMLFGPSVGILVIGLDALPDNNNEEPFLLDTGTKALLAPFRGGGSFRR